MLKENKMRLVVFQTGADTPRVGELSTDGTNVSPLVVSGPVAREGVLLALDEDGRVRALPRSGENLRLSDLKLLAPVPRPRRNVFCVGKNYHEHVKEFARSGYDSSATTEAPPEAPIVFSKLPECVIAHGEPIEQDAAVSTDTDYEAELGVIIGKGGRGISAAGAMSHVAGFTILNDVTARDIQKTHKQWLLGKSQDTYCPMGPCFVSPDEIDLAHAMIRCWVNEELRQEASVSQMIFDIPTLIAAISRGITLQAGDIIATGTPSGVAVGFTPPRWLKPGDRVRISITGIGTLENVVQARQPA